MKLYIVTGETGEYSDREEWLVLAYTDKLLAQQHVQQAEQWFREHGPYAGLKPRSDNWETYCKWHDNMPPNPYDSQMQVDYTGTGWFVQEVEMAPVVS